MHQPSKYQQDIYDKFNNTDVNINISAVAGSGKTTVLLNLLQFVKKDSNALFVAFNNSIVDELKKRIGVKNNVEISTIHSFGWQAIMKRYGKPKLNQNKVIAKIEKLFETKDEYKELKERKKGYYFYIVNKIIDLMRCNLTECTLTAINELCERYDLFVGEKEIKIALEVFALMESDKTQFDFTDMIYQPVVDASIRVRKFDYVFCDESQDFSLAQQKLIKMCLNRKGRLITVGDKHQSIYGFAGAEAESYEKLSKLNGDSEEMPLSVSYRCSRAVVMEAKEIVPEISYSDDAKEGMVIESNIRDNLQMGDWIICRNLKPLVQTYFWLMKNKIKSKIKGKDIGEGIIGMINQTGAKTLGGMWNMLKINRDKLFKKLQERGVRNPSLHPKMELYSQRLEVIECLMGEVNNVTQLITLIKNIFSDENKGIILSTIHKSKGLENDRIFFLCPELIPSRFATQDWMIEQEMNLKYVAITRAKSTLIYVSGADFREDILSTIKIN